MDYSIFCISDNNLLKGGVFLALLWGFWFLPSAEQRRNRIVVISTLTGSLLALAVNQVAQRLGPFRLRPYAAGLPGIQFPYHLGIREVSSFPSDHAALFCGLSTGLFFLSRRIGLTAFFYATAVIFLPRIYLGLHYPSDILGGAIIGIGCVCLIHGTRLRNLFADFCLKMSNEHPATFYAAMFLLTYQTATLFDDARALAAWLSAVLG